MELRIPSNSPIPQVQRILKCCWPIVLNPSNPANPSSWTYFDSTILRRYRQHAQKIHITFSYLYFKFYAPILTQQRTSPMPPKPLEDGREYFLLPPE